MEEEEYDRLLNIYTGMSLRDRNHVGNFHYHPYEPTPYEALEKLFSQYKMKRSDHIVDFGSGKGRLLFYVHHLFQSHVAGVEMDEELHLEALMNKESYNGIEEDAIQFYHCFAEDYIIQPGDNRFYFFNPFSPQIFYKIVTNIMRSLEDHERDVELLLYYPSEEYMLFLESQTAFQLKEVIELPGLYEKDPSEKFLVYNMPY